MAMTEVWSCGGGKQSAAIAVLILQGQVPKPDLAVMVDTEREKSSTWEYLRAVVMPPLHAIGVDLAIVRKSAYATVDLYASNGDLLLPVFTSSAGRLSGFCSNEWKQRVVQRWLRGQGVETGRCWIGFSLDEKDRVRHAPPAWLQRWHPLIEARMRRSDCIRLVEDYGWPSPPRSACWMCPHMSNDEWREERDHHPEDFAKAVALDHAIREKDPDVYVHRSGTPLATADLGADQPSLFGESERGCDSGHCFV